MKIQNVLNQTIGIFFPYVKQNVICLSNEKSLTIWFSENRFPIDIINTGTPSSELWEGEHDVLTTLRDVEKQGFTIEMKERTVGDETSYDDPSSQDFKLIITKNP
tara:strand:+ start:44558 stop:44872 length:315 start_codon:yes stop_codon:yes gene_type:complete